MKKKTMQIMASELKSTKNDDKNGIETFKFSSI